MAYENQMAGALNKTSSRIENDVEQVKRFTTRVEQTTSRIVQHARALGYYEPTSESKAVTAPSPVIATLADAIRELDRALDHCSGSLNVFD